MITLYDNTLGQPEHQQVIITIIAQYSMKLCSVNLTCRACRVYCKHNTKQFMIMVSCLVLMAMHKHYTKYTDCITDAVSG